MIFTLDILELVFRVFVWDKWFHDVAELIGDPLVVLYSVDN